ncbi:MAG TPA: type II secretion system protein [Candidatus Saccharimonadales bacterium]
MLNRLNKTKQQKSDQGFTIIEVMIVLAIAGLILLIVFLAVPALQRNSRNTQRKNDVSALIGAVNEYTSNNNGTLPTTSAQVLALSKPGYFTSGPGAGPGQVNLLTGAQPALPGTAAGDRVVVVTGAQCGAAGITTAGNARQVSIQYQIETAGSWTPTCQSS